MVAEDRVTVGIVSGAFGVKGWIRIQSHCRPPEQLLDYGDLWIAGQRYTVLEGRRQGLAVVARLEGLGEREVVAALRGQTIEVARSKLPAPEDGAYYWADLMGCRVVDCNGVVLGLVERLFDTGAQDVLVLSGAEALMIPFVQGPVVRSVDLQRREIVVDWPPS